MSFFQFKQFAIKQDECAMKVGTDGVLLGAWAKAVKGNVLDVGCGTGLLALMMAQRETELFVDAIDVEESAYLQSIENVSLSKWGDNINVFHTTLQTFKTEKQYHHIISNPPFFVKSYKAPDKARATARHTDGLPFEELIIYTKRLLKKEGLFSLVLPIVEGNQFIQLALVHGLYLNRKCEVFPNNTKPSKRLLLEFSFFEKKLIEEKLTIETDVRHQYTKEYISLTQDFYLYDR